MYIRLTNFGANSGSLDANHIGLIPMPQVRLVEVDNNGSIVEVTVSNADANPLGSTDTITIGRFVTGTTGNNQTNILIELVDTPFGTSVLSNR